MENKDYIKETIYPGADYGLNPSYGKEFSLGLSPGYEYSFSQFGFPSDPTSANQLDKVSRKLNTGAKTIEVSGVSIMGGGAGGLVEKIPKQHFKEINRLKKLAGVDLTFHGPLVEASGFERESGWSELNRENQERQLWSAVERAHELEPTGNIVVTLHSSSGLPELRTRIKGKDGEEVPDIVVIDERTGSADRLKR